MNSNMTFPHTFESGITVLRVSAHGAALVSDGINVAWIQGRWIRKDGTLTDGGMRALLESNKTVEEQEAESVAWKEKKERERTEREEAWKKQKEEGSKILTFVIEHGILKSAGPSSYKYVIGRKRDMYGRPCNYYNYIPKSMVTVERKNNKVYVTLPKWLADKHSIFKTVE